MYAKDDNYVTDKAHRKSVNRGLYAGSINSAKEDIKESKKSIATATDLQGKVEKVAKSKKKK
jgi:hypothetical protein